jgi:hypothetical protein
VLAVVPPLLLLTLLLPRKQCLESAALVVVVVAARLTRFLGQLPPAPPAPASSLASPLIKVCQAASIHSRVAPLLSLT